MRKVSAVLSIILMLLSFSVSAEKNLSIEEAKKLAIENSNLLKAADIKIEGDEINAREMLAEKNRTKNTSVAPGYGAVSVVESTMLRRGYYSDMAASQLTLSKLDKEKIINGIEVNTISAYYSLINARENLKVGNESLKIAKEISELVKMKYSLGTASESEVKLADLTVNNTQHIVDVANRAVEFAELSLNKVLGLEASEKVIPTDVLKIVPPDEINIDDCINSALENKYEVIAAKLQLSLAEKEAECYGAFYTKGTYFYKLKEYNVEIAKSTLENTKKDISLSIRKSYYDYLDSYKAALMSEETVKAAELTYNMAKSKYEIGMGTYLEVKETGNELDNAKLQKAKADTAYNLAKLMFESSLKI